MARLSIRSSSSLSLSRWAVSRGHWELFARFNMFLLCWSKFPGRTSNGGWLKVSLAILSLTIANTSSNPESALIALGIRSLNSSPFHLIWKAFMVEFKNRGLNNNCSKNRFKNVSSKVPCPSHLPGPCMWTIVEEEFDRHCQPTFLPWMHSSKLHCRAPSLSNHVP